MLDIAAAEFQNQIISPLEEILHLQETIVHKPDDRDLRRRLYLAWHEIKAVASLFNFHELTALAHAVESVVEPVHGMAGITKETVFLFERAVAYIKKFIEARIYKQPLSEDGASIISDLKDYSRLHRQKKKKKGAASRKPRILVVDDDPTDQTLIEALIHAVDGRIEVKVADCAEEGLFYFFTDSFDLVFLDIMMPIIDGQDFIAIVERNLHRDHLTRPCNIIVETAIQANSQLNTLVKSECVQEVLRKPVDAGRIRQCIERYCLDPKA